VIQIGSIGMGYETKTTNNINYALIRKDLLVNVPEGQLMKEVAEFLQENYLKEGSNLKIEDKYGRKTVIFNDPKNPTISISLIYDERNTYFNIVQKVRLILAMNSAILNLFNKMKAKLEEQNLLSGGFNSYLLMMMIITSCQMEFESTKVKEIVL